SSSSSRGLRPQHRRRPPRLSTTTAALPRHNDNHPPRVAVVVPRPLGGCCCSSSQAAPRPPTPSTSMAPVTRPRRLTRSRAWSSTPARSRCRLWGDQMQIPGIISWLIIS
uniref:Uncharacterized protein n=1 Tax=Triticum urartu TaxID=4572 RepID=A0A8R7QFZ7_TRIUA